MMNELFHEVVPVILKHDDLNSMYFSVENRSPYLDLDLFDFANTIPSRHLIKDGYGKYVLRMAMEGILHDDVRLSKQKKGFNASISSIIDFDNKDNLDLLLSDSPVYEYVDKSKIEKLVGSKSSIENNYSKFLFNILSAKFFISSQKEKAVA